MNRVIAGAAGVSGLALVFLFQRLDVLAFLTGVQGSPDLHFGVNRFIRIFLNDAFMLLVLYALFCDIRVLRLAIWIQLIDLFLLFPVYLAFKLTLEGASEISSPFLSQLHRLIVHPTLLILLIPAIYYQRLVANKG